MQIVYFYRLLQVDVISKRENSLWYIGRQVNSLTGLSIMIFFRLIQVKSIVEDEALTLFSMMFSAMLTNAFQYCDDRFPIRYRFDGKLFNLRMLQAKSKMQTGVLDEFLYADDVAKNVSTVRKMRDEVRYRKAPLWH